MALPFAYNIIYLSPEVSANDRLFFASGRQHLFTSSGNLTRIITDVVELNTMITNNLVSNFIYAYAWPSTVEFSDVHRSVVSHGGRIVSVNIEI